MAGKTQAPLGGLHQHVRAVNQSSHGPQGHKADTGYPRKASGEVRARAESGRVSVCSGREEGAFPGGEDS